LLLDLRAHGQSGGDLATGGYLERDDLDAVIDPLGAERPTQARRVLLFGASTGGAVAVACAARRDDLAGVVADGLFADYRDAARVHATLVGAPALWLQPLAIRWAERRSGARFADVRPIDLLRAVRCPVMVVHGEADPFSPPAVREAFGRVFADRADARDEHWVLPGVGHLLALAAEPDAYRRRVASFVDRATRDDPTRE